MPEKKLIIVPDVHGRRFWEIVKKFKNNQIVFLGDYLDPYTQIEGIERTQAIDNFKEILEFAEENKNNVTLLYGNHDSSYAFKNQNLCMCRYDRLNHIQCETLFDDYRYLFKFAYDTTINGNKYLLTHAGVNPLWVKVHSELFKPDFKYTANELNKIPISDLISPLCDVGLYRGGWNEWSSFIWADIKEHIIDVKKMSGIGNFMVPEKLIQIVGHTWLQHPICFDCAVYKVFCLDIGTDVFYLDENGNIHYLSDDKVVETKS